MIKRLILMLKALRIYAVSGSLPTTSEIEQKCDFVAMKDGYDITGGGTVADFTDGFMKGALWMKRVVESGGNDR
jgi:hypothetical protein